MPVYLHLFHGRLDPDQEMDDWGEDGPVLGPLEWIHTTYASEIKLRPSCAPDCIYIPLVQDTLHYDGWFYGDWSIFGEEAPEVARAVPIDPAKCAVIPAFERLLAACEACLAREEIADDQLIHQIRGAVAAARREQKKETP